MVVILKVHNSLTEKKWRQTLLAEGFVVYDVKYPYRMAGRIILRQENQDKNSAPVEDFATFLAYQTSAYYGTSHIATYFLDWYKSQRRGTRSRVVVCGLGVDDMSTLAIEQLRSIGAVVVAEEGLQGDFHVEKERDLPYIFSKIKKEFKATK